MDARPIIAAASESAGSPALARAIRAASVLFVTALTAAASQVSVPLPFTPVPLTLQPMIVVLGGAALGWRLGMVSQVLYLAAGIAALPVFAASPALLPGAARLLGPTAGYLWSYPLAAFAAGALAQRGFDRRYATAVLAMAAGRVPAEEQARRPDVPWSLIIGLRNRLIHGYDEVDHDVVWQIVTTDLPLLVLELSRSLPEDDSPD